MNMMEDIQASYNLVWAFRAAMEPYWKTPPPADCIRYAFTEMGEVMDAYLREKRPNDSRNNYRSPGIEDEIGDMVIMLFSAVVGGFDTEPFPLSSGVDLMGTLCSLIGVSVGSLPTVIETTVNKIVIISQACIGGRMYPIIIKRLKSIYLKHHPNPTIREWEQITGDPSERPVHLSEILPQQREAMDGMLGG